MLSNSDILDKRILRATGQASPMRPGVAVSLIIFSQLLGTFEFCRLDSNRAHNRMQQLKRLMIRCSSALYDACLDERSGNLDLLPVFYLPSGYAPDGCTFPSNIAHCRFVVPASIRPRQTAHRILLGTLGCFL